MAAISPDYERGCAPVVALNHGAALLARIECDQCGAIDEWRVAGRRPPSEILPKHFANKGWRIAKRVVCPECQIRKEKPMATVTQIKTEPKPDMQARKIDVILALEDYFDRSSGQYKAGKDDKALADEVGVSPKFVADVRDEFRYVLKQPNEIAEMRAELTAALDKVEAIQARFDKLCIKQGWAA